MLDIKRLKNENKELRSRLSKEDKNFLLEVSYYLNQYQLSSLEYYEFMNQIYIDALSKTQDKQSLWIMVENPVEYCDHFLLGKEKKNRSYLGYILWMIIAFISLISITVLVENLTRSNLEILYSENGYTLTSGMIIRTLAYILFSFIPLILRQKNPFDQSRYEVKFFGIQTLILFFMLMIGAYAEHSFVLNVNRYIVYASVILGISIFIFKAKKI